MMEATKPDKFQTINICWKNKTEAFIYFFKILENGPQLLFYIHGHLAGESAYRGIPAAAGVAEISKASAGYLRVGCPEGPFSFHSGNQQICIKLQLCAGLSFGQIPTSLLKLWAAHWQFSTPWTKKCGNPIEITRGFPLHCTVMWELVPRLYGKSTGNLLQADLFQEMF